MYKRQVSKTVLRAGYGFFYDRFKITNLMDLEQFGGDPLKSQTQTVISNPSCFDPTSLSSAIAQGCGNGSQSVSQINTCLLYTSRCV